MFNSTTQKKNKSKLSKLKISKQRKQELQQIKRNIDFLNHIRTETAIKAWNDGITQQEIADALGVQQSTVSGWVRNSESHGS